MLPNTRFVRVHPATSGWPDATNTGVLGASLSTVSVGTATWHTSTDGAALYTTEVIGGNTYHVFSNYNFVATTGYVYVDDTYVKFNKCAFSTSGYVSNTSSQVQFAPGSLECIVQDCDFDGGAAYHNRNVNSTHANLHVFRCNMTNFGNSAVEADISGGTMEIRDSYMHEPKGWQLADHIDAIQTDGPLGDITIVHNTIVVEPYGYADHDYSAGNISTSCINLSTQLGNVVGDCLIDRNWIAGGGFCMYISNNGGGTYTGTCTVTNNVFDRNKYPSLTPHVSAWGYDSNNNSILYPTLVWPSTSANWAGNTFEDQTTAVTYAMAIS